MFLYCLSPGRKIRFGHSYWIPCLSYFVLTLLYIVNSKINSSPSNLVIRNQLKASIFNVITNIEETSCFITMIRRKSNSLSKANGNPIMYLSLIHYMALDFNMVTHELQRY